MRTAEQEPISRERFKNNADRLIFPDRHEYRTRSRVLHFVYGVFSLAMFVMSIGFPAWTIFVAAQWGGPRYVGQIRMFGYISGVVFLGAGAIFVWLALFCFFFNPRVVVSSAGIDFVRWMPDSFRFRLKNFRVEFDDLSKIEIVTKGEAGLRGNRASTFFHLVQIYAEGQYDLKLPWKAYEKDEAERFMAAFIDSIQKLANRNLPAPYR